MKRFYTPFGLFPLVLLLSLAQSSAKLSDSRLCADPSCQTKISEGVTKLRYPSVDKNVLSFKAGEKVTIYSKSVGTNPDLWEVEINGKRGYAPKSLIVEKSVSVAKPTFEVPIEESDALPNAGWEKEGFTERQDPKPGGSQEEDIKASKTLPVVFDGTTLYDQDVFSTSEAPAAEVVSEGVSTSKVPFEVDLNTDQSTKKTETIEAATASIAADDNAQQADVFSFVSNLMGFGDDANDEDDDDDDDDDDGGYKGEEDAVDEENSKSEENTKISAEHQYVEAMSNEEKLTIDEKKIETKLLEENIAENEEPAVEAKSEEENITAQENIFDPRFLKDKIKANKENIATKIDNPVGAKNNFSANEEISNLTLEKEVKVLPEESKTTQAEEKTVETMSAEEKPTTSKPKITEKEVDDWSVEVKPIPTEGKTDESMYVKEKSIKSEEKITGKEVDGWSVGVKPFANEEKNEESMYVKGKAITRGEKFTGNEVDDWPVGTNTATIEKKIVESKSEDALTRNDASSWPQEEQSQLEKSVEINNSNERENELNKLSNVSVELDMFKTKKPEKWLYAEKESAPADVHVLNETETTTTESSEDPLNQTSASFTLPPLADADVLVEQPSLPSNIVAEDHSYSRPELDASSDRDIEPVESAEESISKTTSSVLFGFSALFFPAEDLGDGVCPASDRRKSSSTLLYLATTAFTVLLFTLGHYYIERLRHDSRLIARINHLEHQLMLASAEEHSPDFGDKVHQLTQQLEESDAAKAELEELVASLERELETATEAGLELNQMLGNFLSGQNASEATVQNFERLQVTIGSVNAALVEKTKQNEELAEQLARASAKSGELKAEVAQVLQRLVQVEEEKSRSEVGFVEEIVGLKANLDAVRKDNEELQAKLHQQLEAHQLHSQELSRAIELKTAEAQHLQTALSDLAQGKELKALLDVSQFRAQHQVLRKDHKQLQEKLRNVGQARQELETQLKTALEAGQRFKDKCDAVEAERIEAHTKLEVLGAYFREAEAELQKRLNKQEALWAEREGEATSTSERVKYMQEELLNYKSQNETLKREILDQEVSLKSQISLLEKKAHDSWMLARQAERRLEESRMEASQLRNRLTTLVEKSNAKDELSLLNNGEQHVVTSPLHMLAEPPLPYPLEGLFPPPPLPPPGGSFMPPFMPPPPPGAPFMPPPPPPHLFPGDHRPPPLGRLSSPPPVPPAPGRFSPPDNGRHYSPDSDSSFDRGYDPSRRMMMMGAPRSYNRDSRNLSSGSENSTESADKSRQSLGKV